MGIRVFISGNSGNKEIVTHQARILMILDGLGMEVEVVDITAPGMKEATDFMRSNGKKKEGERNVLPPQIFNGDKYCGDYEDFDVANEDDELEEFLGIPRKSPKFDPNAGTNTGGDPGKLEQPPTVNGTSDDKSELQKEEVQQATNPSEDSEQASSSLDTDKEATEADLNGHDNEDKNTENGSEQTLNTEEEEKETLEDITEA